MITEKQLEAALENITLLSDNLFMEIGKDYQQMEDSIQLGTQDGLNQTHQKSFEIGCKASRANALREAATLIRWHIQEQRKHEKTKNST